MSSRRDGRVAHRVGAVVRTSPTWRIGFVSMSMQYSRWAVPTCSITLAAVLAAVASGPFFGHVARAGGAAEADPAVERTREQVQMLDDLYKNAVVSITRRYVGNKDADPAIKVAKDVFGAMKKKGWHSARLVDATGEPMDEANAPKTDFEKEAARDQLGQALLRPRRRRGEGPPPPGRDRRARRHGEVRRVPHAQEGGRGAGLHPVRRPDQVIDLARSVVRTESFVQDRKVDPHGGPRERPPIRRPPAGPAGRRRATGSGWGRRRRARGPCSGTRPASGSRARSGRAA